MAGGRCPLVSRSAQPARRPPEIADVAAVGLAQAGKLGVLLVPLIHDDDLCWEVFAVENRLDRLEEQARSIPGADDQRAGQRPRGHAERSVCL